MAGVRSYTVTKVGQKPFSFWRRYASNALFFLYMDAIALSVSLILGDLVLEWLRGIPIQTDRGFLLIPMWCAGALVMRLAPGWGESATESLRRKVILITACYGVVLVVVFITKSDVSRITLIGSYVCSLLLIPLFRNLGKRLLIRWGRWGVPVVVYGNSHTASLAVQAMQHEPGLGYQAIGVFDDELHAGDTLNGVTVIGRMVDHTSAAPVAVWAMPARVNPDVSKRLLNEPLAKYQKVILLPDALEIPTLWVRPRDFMGVLGLEVSQNLLNPPVRALKTFVETMIILLSIPVWLPLNLLIALLIWMEDRASPFFSQPRVGRNGKVFRVIKFRSMVPDAERVLKRALAADPVLKAEWEAHRKLKKDPRITRVGRWLRVTSLDELPQMFNVLAGQMSLVGPRPLPDYHHSELDENTRHLREQVRPGMTGLWQVSGRSESGTAGMEKWDSYYVRNWSIWLDIIVFARTVGVVWRGRGAY